MREENADFIFCFYLRVVSLLPILFYDRETHLIAWKTCLQR